MSDQPQDQLSVLKLLTGRFDPAQIPQAKDSRSELQLRDVRSVLRLQGATLDRSYLDRWSMSLSVRDLLRELES